MSIIKMKFTKLSGLCGIIGPISALFLIFLAARSCLWDPFQMSNGERIKFECETC